MTEQTYPALKPPIESSRAPSYHELNENPKRFEKLTRRLVAAEPGLRNATLFGVNGEGQFGIDVVADVDSGRVVASCKCVAQATASDIRAWSDEFLENREAHWSDVGRFILATSALNITSVKIYDQTIAEAARFAALGLIYEVWGPEQLTDKIQAAGRELSQRFLDTAWTNVLFGPPAPSSEPTAAQTEQLYKLQTLISTHVDARLRRARDQLRSGDFSSVRALIVELEVPEAWAQLRMPTQAGVLRLKAGLALTVGDLKDARRLAEEAQAKHPTEPRLLAMITARESGAAAALEVLGQAETRDGRQAMVALHLEANQIEQADVILQSLVLEDPTDAETLQLLAYVRLAQNRRAEALDAAIKGEQIAPHWLGIIRVGAIARYASALSPLADRSCVLQPNPLDDHLLKIDDDSRRAMSEALAGFERLIATGPPHDMDRSWQLACLVNLPGREVEAQAAVDARLAESPFNLEALGWAALRGLNAPLEPSRVALSARYAAGAASDFEVMGYANLLARMDGPEMAANLLLQDVDKQQPAAAEAARNLIAQLLADAGQPSGGSIDPITNALRSAERTGDWTGVEHQLQLALGELTLDPPAWILATETAKRGRWSLLSPYTDALEPFETAEAFNLIAHILQHTGDSSEVLAFLGRRRGAFPGSQLPVGLRRIEIQAHFEGGDLPAALSLAERLILETSQARDRILLCNIHVASGHAQAAIPSIRVLLASGALTADQAIRFAQATTQEDRGLAQDLWRAALALEISDATLLPAIGLAFRLGLDDEAGSLMMRLHARAAAGAPDVWVGDTADMVEHLKARHERGQDVGEMLAKGEVAIHLAMRATGGSLGQLYRLRPTTPDRSPLPVLLMRHGQRPSDLRPDLDWRDWKVHLDVTSLLIASQLDLLDALEALPAPIIVSRSLPDALYQFERDATSQQRKLVEAATEVRDARLKGRLRVLDEQVEEAVCVRHERPFGDGQGVGPTLSGVRRALITSGAIEAATGSRIQLAPDGEGPTAVTPAIGARLVFPDNTLETLAMAGLLEPALSNFQCEVPLADFDFVQQRLDAASAGESLATDIAGLRGRVARGIETGAYVYAPDSTAHLKPTAEGDAPDDALSLCLLDLIGAPGIENGIVWIDDRYATGFRNAGQNLVVSVVEVLNALQSAGLLSSEDHRLKLLKLRAAGAAFIPISTDEVLPALRRAPVDESGELVESRELATLRRNFSAALRLDPKLSTGETQDRPNEIGFLLSSRRLVEECLRLVWSEPDIALEIRLAWSEWLWVNLRMEQSLRVFPGDDDGASSEALAAMLVSGLLANACFMNVEQGIAGSDLAAAFVGWVEGVALSPRVDLGDERFLDVVTSQVKALLSVGDLDAVEHGEAGELAVKFFRNRALELMPAPIQQRLLKDPAFAASAAVRSVLQLEFAGTPYPAEAFWGGCRTALLTGSAEVKTMAGDTIALTSDGETVTVHSDPPTPIREASFAALRADGEARREAIDTLLAPLDLPPDERAGFLDRASSANAVADMMFELAAAYEASPVILYQQMEQGLLLRRPVGTESFMPPTAGRLLHHLRLAKRETPFATRAVEGWRALAAEIGPQFAFRRLAGLPIPLGPVIAETLQSDGIDIAAMPPPASPVMILHVASTAMVLGDGQNAEQLLIQLCEDLRGLGEVFSTLLRWSERAFQSDASWRKMQPAEQLALVWSHAHRVTIMLVETNVDLAFAQTFFADHQPQRSLGAALEYESALRWDCAAPDNLFPSALLYHGLGYALTGRPLSDFPAVEVSAQAVLVGAADGELQPGLVMRAAEAENHMGSFLGIFPEAGVLKGADQARLRAGQLESLVARLEVDPNDANAWITLSVVGRPRLSAELGHRMSIAFGRTSFWTVRQAPEGIHGCRAALDAMLRLGEPLPQELVLQKFHELANGFGSIYRTPFAGGDGSAAADQMAAVLETAAVAARANTVRASFENFERLSLQIASAWPSAAPAIRQMFDAITRGVSPRESGPLWRAYLALRAWP